MQSLKCIRKNKIKTNLLGIGNLFGLNEYTYTQHNIKNTL